MGALRAFSNTQLALYFNVSILLGPDDRLEPGKRHTPV